MKIKGFIITGLLLMFGHAHAQTTRPALSAGQIEVVANLAFNREEYANALPMYERLIELYAEEPEKIEAISEHIRVCKRNLKNPASPAAAPSKPAAEPRKPIAKPKAGEVLELEIRDLGNFDYDPQKGGVPEDVLALSGVKIRTRGFMIPIDQAQKMTRFALVPSLMNCCLGQPPSINHMIVVRAPRGKTIGFSPKEITVEGSLTVMEKKEEGFVVSVFEVDCTSVKAALKE